MIGVVLTVASIVATGLLVIVMQILVHQYVDDVTDWFDSDIGPFPDYPAGAPVVVGAIGMLSVLDAIGLIYSLIYFLTR